MKERTKKIIDLSILFALTGMGVALALNSLPYIKSLSILYKILAMSAAQFGIAGFGLVIIMLWRKEKFSDFGLIREKTMKSLAVGFGFVIIYLAATYFIEGSLNWMPFKQVDITKPALALGFPLNVLGILLIALCWGFFEGFNLVYISKKLNSLFAISNPFLRPGPIAIVVCNILVHMAMGQSFLNAASGSIATYAVVIIPELTGNTWGSILIFLMLWNAI